MRGAHPDAARARAANFELTATPSTKEAQAIADELYADFVSQVRALRAARAAAAPGARGGDREERARRA